MITTLEQQERDLVFPSFDHTDAWRLGSRITATAQQAGHPVGIDVPVRVRGVGVVAAVTVSADHRLAAQPAHGGRRQPLQPGGVDRSRRQQHDDR
ncbi:hypothetical protein GCM10009557_58730 [Virgisporangium ochraceum]